MALSFERARPRTWLQDAASFLSLALAWVLQRVPFSAHFCVMLLAMLGPVFAPHLVAFVVVAVHVVFVACQTRSAYGVWACWRGTLAHSRRDWREYHADERRKLARHGGADHVLDIDDVQHIIIVPAYKEDLSTLRETLDVLASHPLAPTSYHVCLGMEEREAGAPAKASSVLAPYRARGAFASSAFSLHPGNIVGESAGKSSNVNWAARHMARRAPVDHSRTVITVMDADTAFAADFFLSISAYFALAPADRRRRTYYVPPTLFDRNGPDVPIFIRVTDVFWSCAGIGQIYPSSGFKAPTSAYAVSMELVKFCDFWEGGPEAIGEDLHFSVKAVFDTKGTVIAQTIYSPASQLHVVGAPASGPVMAYVHDLQARWSQAVRHLWGSLDFGYSWHRVLTGQFGPGQRKTGYVALNTEDDDDDMDMTAPRDEEEGLRTTYLLPTGVHLEDPHRYPSPSNTATTDATLTEFDTVMLPRAAKKVHGDDDGQESDSSGEDICIKHTHARGLSLASRPGRMLHNVMETDLACEMPARARLMPFISLFFRLFEAHIMIASMFVLMAILTIYPSVVYRSGRVAFTDPFNRPCTWEKCVQAIFESPFSAGAALPRDTAPGMTPAWMMPDIVICAIQLARALGGVGIAATILMCFLHDYYHKAAATTRWTESEAVARSWREAGSVGRAPARFLGVRPAQTCTRKWPRALIDYLAIPAGLAYGVAPMLYAQLCHLHTNRLTYTVSAKSKTIVLATPFTAEAETRLSLDTSRRSTERIRQSVEIGRISSDGRGMRRFYNPEGSMLGEKDALDKQSLLPRY